MEDFGELKTLISSILISKPRQTTATTIAKLNDDFYKQIGCRIPYSQFGFQSLEQCLHSMTDILQVNGTGMNASLLVRVSDKAAHIDKLISNQRIKQPPRKCFVNRYKAPKQFIACPQTNCLSQNVQANICLRKLTASPGDFIPSQTYRSMQYTRNYENSCDRPMHDIKLMSKPATNKCTNNIALQPKSENPTESNSDAAAVGNDITVNDINNYTQLQTNSKGPTTSSSLELQDLKTEDIYLSDEEEPLNHLIPFKVQQNLQVLINTCDDGIWCGKIPELYKQLFSMDLHHEKYGYKSLIQMCMDLKNIFYWHRPDKGDFRLYDRTKPLPNDLDKDFKQSEYIKVYDYLSVQPSSEPPIPNIEELIGNAEPEEYYPPDVVHLMEELPRQFLPKVLDEEFIDVCVGEIYDPSKFWIMLRDFTPLLDQLMDDMQSFYLNSHELKMPQHMVKIGLYCAAVYNHEYHRAIIVNLMPQQKDKVKVFYIDYGTVSSTLLANLHFLHTKFFQLPQQAIRARLAFIYPPFTNTMWSYETSSRFLDLVRMKNLVAHIYSVDETQKIVEIFLVDTSGEDDIYMNDTMVNEGLACFINEPQEEIPLDPRIIPKVKDLHLVPTFDELEQGLVPNASEMIRLQKVGVSLEQILSQYYTHISTNEMQSMDSEKKPNNEPKPETSSLAVQQSHLKSLAGENKPNLHNDSCKLAGQSCLGEQNSASPERIVNISHIRPPPGFEKRQEKPIAITTQLNEDQMINTVVTQTTNIESTNWQQTIESPNVLNEHNNSIQNTHRPTILKPNQITLENFNGNALQQPTLMSRNVPSQNHQLAYKNTSPNNTNYKSALNRMIYIIQKNRSLSGKNDDIFKSLLKLVNDPTTDNQHLKNIYSVLFKKLSYKDIMDLYNDGQSKSNSASTQTHNVSATEVSTMVQQVQQMNLLDPTNNFVNVSRHISDPTSNIEPMDNTNQWTLKDKQLVIVLEYQNHRLHMIKFNNETYLMVSEVLQIVNEKMPIEMVRKRIVMQEPSISVTDIRLQDHKDLLQELSRYMYVDSSYILNVVPVNFVPKLITILTRQIGLASNFYEFLRDFKVSNLITL